MAISLTLNFDNDWAARLTPMVQYKVNDARNNPVILSLLDSLPGIETVDDLTVKQKAKLWILFRLLCDLSIFEGQEAAANAQIAVIEDIEQNFPLEIGEE